jgi:CelD/BcsL family acetyltransferase involved in cellulose biosynthesis
VRTSFLKVALEYAPGASWDNLVSNDSRASFFHERVWADALASVYRHFTPFFITVRSDSGALLAGLPATRSVRMGLTQILSQPFGTYGCPLIGGDLEPSVAERLLIERWRQEASKTGTIRAHLTLRPRSFPSPAARVPNSWKRPEQTHVVDLSDGELGLWRSRFCGAVRSSCRHAERLGIAVAEESNPNGVLTLETLYRRVASDWPDHKLYAPGLFERLLTHASRHTMIWIARRDGSPLAATLVFRYRNTLTSWLTVLTQEARRIRAGVLLHGQVMRFGCRNGFTEFNFGASQGARTLISFKESMGGTAVDYESYLRQSTWFSPLHGAYRALSGMRA